jgi:hypothetical protein
VGVAVEGFTESPFTALGRTYPVYRRGSGPAVIVIHEVPGLTPLVAQFGREVADAGLTAVLPSLFGEPGRPMTAGYAAKSFFGACVSKEFHALALGQTSPIIDWLRELARHEHSVCGGPGVGAVGMCFTGGFALGMMVDPVVKAPVLSQPSSPLPIGRRRRASVGLSDSDFAAVKERVAEGTCVLGLRYSGDVAVPDARFETLRELGDGFIAVELPGRKHSVLTEHRDDESVRKVLDFFRERLLPT